jgi:hypothetical protein
MSRYTVTLTDDAEQALAAIWVQAPDRAAVTSAEAAIYRLLGNDPLNVGVEVCEGLRKLTVSPLAAFYTVDTGKQTVEVQQMADAP